MPSAPHAGREVYGGLFLLTMATVLHEVLLTRLFSVTMWYHFAFMAISVTMFGMTVGALLVYLLPARFPDEGLPRHLALGAGLFGVTGVLSLLTHLSIPFVLDYSLTGVFSVLLTLGVISVPFVFAGIAVTLVLTRFTPQLGSLYAVDLAGAAVGCALMGPLLGLTDGPGALVAVAALAALAGLLFERADPARSLRQLAGATFVFLLAAAAIQAVLLQKGVHLLKIMWIKGERAVPLIHEDWNAFSRVSVEGNEEELVAPFGWGLSPVTPAQPPLGKLMVRIDATAGTTMWRTEGDPARREFLRHDVTSVAHHLRPGARTMVVGVGGGRDVLAALAFDPPQVTGVELNEDILALLQGPFLEFTDKLAEDPRVRLVADEARSFLARQTDRFDILQVTLIDTWAATAAGAYVLSENTLYTVEAWSLFLDRLQDRGLLSFSRFYHRPFPVEVMRTLSLGASALRSRGVEKPQDHMALVLCGPVATLLVSPSPLATEDVTKLTDVANSLKFEILLAPGFSKLPWMATLANSRDPEKDFPDLPFKVTAPTDDCPFFFQPLRLSRALDRETWATGGLWFNVEAVISLTLVMLGVLFLAALVLLVPVVARPGGARPRPALTLYFLGIGLGFMFLEVAMMQRLVVLLGHPAYALTVVLGTLLLSGGCGSWIAGAMLRRGRSGTGSLWVLLAAAITSTHLVPELVQLGEGWTTPARIGLAAGLLFPLGILMGMPFPLGMDLASRLDPDAAPWLFAVNGAASITASVLAIVIAVSAGITAACWAGVAAYLLAALSFGRLQRTHR